MKVTVNGKEREFDYGITLALMLESLNLDVTGMIVERNLEVVPKSEYDTLTVEEGDRIELIRLVAGG